LLESGKEMKLEHWDSQKWGALSEANMCKKLEAEGYSVHKYVYPPGTVFLDHSHSIQKKDAVLSGRFLLASGPTEFILEAGDMLEVPAGTVHRASVVGNEPVVSLDATKIK
jgi:quercetin dioxygenase-like cupin family protein